jgi:hypothetical protein
MNVIIALVLLAALGAGLALGLHARRLAQKQATTDLVRSRLATHVGRFPEALEATGAKGPWLLRVFSQSKD